MKSAAVFLVLSLVVLMAEPGEGFLHHIFNGIANGIANVGKMIHGFMSGKHGETQKQRDNQFYHREQADFV